MPYYGYYGGYGDFLANNIYCILLIPVLLLSLWAQAQVSGNFKRYSGVANRRRLTGAQAAEAVLRAHGIYNVAIRPCSGSLTDHYDPRDNSISLSENVYNSTSIAAVGVAAHEAGHAVQYAENYGPVRLRTAIIPATQIGSKFSFILLLVGMVLYSQSLFFVGILLFSLTTIFQLITLPVEFNASHRALQTLENEQLLYDDELPGARKVLKAAALTYVATNIIRVPIPATDGYINLGDCVVLLGAFLLGPVYGAAAGGIGSALADILSGYAVFAPGTFVIKALIAVIAAAILKALGSKAKAAPIVASIAGEAWMLLGYFLYESIFLGYGLAAAGSIGGNAIQAVVGVILASALYAVLSKVPQIKKAAA